MRRMEASFKNARAFRFRDEAGFWRARSQKSALDRRCRQTVSRGMETGLSSSPEVRCRHRGPECRRSARWHGAANPAYLPGYGASCPLSSCPHHSHADRCRPPFFGAFHALTIDDGSARAGFALVLLAALHIKRVMDAIERAVPAPQIEIVEQR